VPKRLTKEELARALAKRWREEVLALRQLPDHDWNDWELDFLESQLFRRPPLYQPSEKEQAVLARMRRDTKQFTGWDGYTVWELIQAVSAYRLDCTERDEAFLDGLQRRGAISGGITLRRRELARLIRLCGVAGVSLAPLEYERDTSSIFDPLPA